MLKSTLSSFIKSQYFGFRGFIVLLGIITSVAVYYYIVDFYNPESNIFNKLKFKPERFAFYSGGEGGFYIRIGKSLQENTKRKKDKIIIENYETAGGSENAIKVLTTPSSFGLVQEETIKENDFIRDNLNYVAPLYMERMHILYKKSSYKKITGSSLKHQRLHLSSNCSKDILKFFSKAKINTGPVGSGTRIISSYIINEINSQLNNNDNSIDQKINSEKTLNAINKLKSESSNELDIMFIISGAPTKEVSDILKNNDDIDLISVDPSFIAQINNEYKVNLRMSDFKTIYEGANDVTTIGSYAFLIASPDVKGSNISLLMKTLNENKGNIQKEMGVKTSNHFQLDEFDFYNSYQSKYEKSRFSLWRDFLLFIVAVSSSSAIIIAFLLWLISTIKTNSYFDDITKIFSDNKIFSVNFEENKKHLLTPLLKINQSNFIENLLKSINSLNELKLKIYKDYNSGGITESHHKYLIDNLNLVKEELKETLGQRLYHHFSFNKQILREETLHLYYSSGFIDHNDYVEIKKIII